MLGREARRRNRLAEMRRFISCFCPTLDKTRQRFFLDATFGTLMSGSLIVARWVRFLKDRCKCLFYTQKRLLNQLKSSDWDHREVLSEYQRHWGSKVEVDTPIIIDLTDLAKPRARKMKYLAYVRDGSEDRLVPGYWCLEAYAHFNRTCNVPLLLEPFSSDDPETISENARILAGVEQIMAATEDKGVLVMDIGADRRELLLPWIDDRRRFVIRLKGDRHLLLANGVRIETAQLAEHLLSQAQGQRIVWQQVFLPERPEVPLYLVVRAFAGSDRPMMLLSSLRAEDLTTARCILLYYRQRWKCEESARLGKTALGMERFCLRTYEAFPRLILVLMLAIGFLSWIELRQPGLIQWLCAKHPGQHKIKFGYYRLLEWLKRQIRPPVVRFLTT
jgi:hypothetical protein